MKDKFNEIYMKIIAECNEKKSKKRVIKEQAEQKFYKVTFWLQNPYSIGEEDDVPNTYAEEIEFLNKYGVHFDENWKDTGELENDYINQGDMNFQGTVVFDNEDSLNDFMNQFDNYFNLCDDLEPFHIEKSEITEDEYNEISNEVPNVESTVYGKIDDEDF